MISPVSQRENLNGIISVRALEFFEDIVNIKERLLFCRLFGKPRLTLKVSKMSRRKQESFPTDDIRGHSL